MRIFTGLKEAYNEIQRDLIEMGADVHSHSMQDKKVNTDPMYKTKELQGYAYKIVSRVRLKEDFLTLGGNIMYADQEVLDRVSQKFLNPGNAFVHRKEVWEEFLHDGLFSYSYNERIREQLPRILLELQKRPATRQAVITMYDKGKDLANLGGKARIPCSMYYQFFIRERNDEPRLDVIYTMRSCDIYTHFIYDVYITMKFQEWIANGLGLEPGNFTHFIGSLHAYRKDYATQGVF